jgi:hypothetical protein
VNPVDQLRSALAAATALASQAGAVAASLPEYPGIGDAADYSGRGYALTLTRWFGDVEYSRPILVCRFEGTVNGATLSGRLSVREGRDGGVEAYVANASRTDVPRRDVTDSMRSTLRSAAEQHAADIAPEAIARLGRLAAARSAVSRVLSEIANVRTRDAFDAVAMAEPIGVPVDDGTPEEIHSQLLDAELRRIVDGGLS